MIRCTDSRLASHIFGSVFYIISRHNAKFAIGRNGFQARFVTGAVIQIATVSKTTAEYYNIEVSSLVLSYIGTYSPATETSFVMSLFVGGSTFFRIWDRFTNYF